MCLEGFQAGLSWITILKKRPAFRECFQNFEIEELKRFGDNDVERMVKDARIIRHRGKIKSVINNAHRASEIIEEQGSLAAFFWQFEPAEDIAVQSKDDVVATTSESTAMSKALKKRGWSFVGPTTCYALMQAMGMANDHLTDCHRWSVIDEARKNLIRPDNFASRDQ